MIEYVTGRRSVEALRKRLRGRRKDLQHAQGRVETLERAIDRASPEAKSGRGKLAEMNKLSESRRLLEHWRQIADMEEKEVEWIEGMLRDIDKERERRGLPPLVEEGMKEAREAEGGYTQSDKEQQYPKAEFVDGVRRPQIRQATGKRETMDRVGSWIQQQGTSLQRQMQRPPQLEHVFRGIGAGSGLVPPRLPSGIGLKMPPGGLRPMIMG